MTARAPRAPPSTLTLTGRCHAASISRRSARSTAGVVLLLVVYQAPLDRQLDVAAGLVFVAALALFAALVAVEVRGILGSSRPRLRVTRALPLGVPFLLVVFAATYCTVSAQQPEAFSEP